MTSPGNGMGIRTWGAWGPVTQPVLYEWGVTDLGYYLNT
jgi:hypothetical protein